STSGTKSRKKTKVSQPEEDPEARPSSATQAYRNTLKTDVFSLADVWTEFRKISIEYYEFDPNYYVSASSLSWDAMLKITGVKIKLFTDMTIHDFIEKAKRG
ncbi:12019_t:CDS:2, partial [Funneliformis geosporum]